ncbi:MAG TPA: hypothetical protein VNJ28_01350 [Candidatus Limnocylindrales bacterium]|nr:hypothetical protein [Candidatus Limnocylindrales bacterium]
MSAFPGLSPSFPRVRAPGTGRPAVQVTSGPGFCYPLYYYVPSLTGDGRHLVFHRAAAGEVQLYRVDLATGQELRLTWATAEETWWRPWCSDAGTGVLDHRSALDVARGEVIFFDGRAVRSADVVSDRTRDLFELPADRLAIGQNCVTPDGRWFVYIHADRDAYLGLFAGDPDFEGYWRRRHEARATHLAAFDLETGEHRTLLVVDSPLHHVLAYDERRLLVCHPTAEPGMLLTDLEGGWYAHLRTQDLAGGKVCHFVGTRRGVAYEVLWGRDGLRAGLYDLDSRRCYEFPLPASFGYVHTGRDPEGARWLFENHTPATHELHFLVRHDPARGDEWLALTGDWPTYGDPDAQKAHFHPQVVLDGRWVLMTAGDPVTRTNQIFLLDVSDLEPTGGIPDPSSRRS